MAKAPAHKTEDPKDLVPTPPSGVPSFLAAKVEEHAGEGVSNDKDDQLIPLVYVLQAQSPQCNKRSSDYVEGAEAGAILLRNSGLPAISGDVGIVCQPIFFSKDFVEWIPRSAGGGFVGRHDTRPPEAVDQPDPQNPNKTQILMPNKNELRETRYHVVRIYLPDGSKMPFVIPMSSSAHTSSRGWMAQMASKVIGGNQAPSYACLYRLKTKERTNAAGTWSTWEILDEGWVQSEEDFQAGADLYAAFASGEKKADIPVDDLEPHTSVGDNAAM